MKAILVPAGFLLASIAASAASPVPHGQQGTYGEGQYAAPAERHSALTRDAVKAQLLNAQGSGVRPFYGETYPASQAAHGGSTREAVVEEMRQLNRQGISLPRGEAS